MTTTIKEFFDHTDFPPPIRLPKGRKKKPYTHIREYRWGGYQIVAGLKDTGSSKIVLLNGGDRLGTLYMRGVTWQEVDLKARELRGIIIAENKAQQASSHLTGVAGAW